MPELDSRLVEEWHPMKNGVLLPTDYSAGSGKKVWWTCSFSHDWEALIINRSKGQGCPYCAGRKVLAGFNDLATTHPELTTQWHPVKNNKVTPQSVSKGHRINIWWLGKCGHEWQATVSNRVHGTNCPVCSNQKIVVGFNDLATTHPDLAAEWYAVKNEITTTQVTYGNSKVFWWKCSKDHIYAASILNRSHGDSCPFCSNRRVLPGYNDLATTHQELVNSWSSKNKLSPTQVSAGSSKRILWECEKGHEWTVAISARNQGYGCPYCSGLKAIQGVNDLATTHPEVASIFHPDKNGKNSATSLQAGSNKKVWWLGECGHEWSRIVDSQVSRDKSCPVCSGSKVLAGFNDLVTTHPGLAAQWHPTKNVKQPTDVSFGHSEVWWLCEKNHEWKAAVYTRTRGVGCPYCRNYTLLAGFNDLQTLNPDVAAEWHPTLNDDLTPDSVLAGSGLKVWWQCKHDEMHVWKTAVIKRTQKNGTGCGKCKTSKPELYLFDLFTSWGLDFVQNDRKVLGGKEIDFLFSGLGVGVEFNGLYWHTEERGKYQTYHYDKWLKAKQAGVSLIQIWEDDWNRNPDAVEALLAERLGVVLGGELNVSDLLVVELDAEHAQGFLEANHIKGFMSGSYYVGLQDSEAHLRAVLVLERERDEVLHIVRYVSAGAVQGGFARLLEHVQRTWKPSSVVGTVDNCSGESALYEGSGFGIREELLPDYRYVRNGERVQGCDLAEVDDLPRVWDAGRTKFGLVFDFTSQCG